MLALTLLEGVIVGLVLSLVRAALPSSRLHAPVQQHGDTVHVHLGGTATFVRRPEVHDTLEAVPHDLDVYELPRTRA